MPEQDLPPRSQGPKGTVTSSDNVLQKIWARINPSQWKWKDTIATGTSVGTFLIALISLTYIDRIKSAQDASNLLTGQVDRFNNSQSTLHRNLSLLAVEHVLRPPTLTFPLSLLQGWMGESAIASRKLLARTAIKIWTSERLKNNIVSPLQTSVAAAEGSIEIQRILTDFLRSTPQSTTCLNDISAISLIDLFNETYNKRRSQLVNIAEYIDTNNSLHPNYQRGGWFFADDDKEFEKQTEKLLRISCLNFIDTDNFFKSVKASAKDYPKIPDIPSEDDRRLIWDAAVSLADLRGLFRDLRYQGGDLPSTPLFYTSQPLDKFRANNEMASAFSSIIYRRSVRNQIRNFVANSDSKIHVFVSYQFDPRKSINCTRIADTKNMQKCTLLDLFSEDMKVGFAKGIGSVYFWDNLIWYSPEQDTKWSEGKNQVIYYHSQDKADAVNLVRTLNEVRLFRGNYEISTSSEYRVKDMTWWPYAKRLPPRQLDVLIVCKRCRQDKG
jgi:hypothetical protein